MVKKSLSPERHQLLLLVKGLQSRMHLPATATQVAIPSLPQIRMLAAVQLLLAKLLGFLCANQLGVTDIVKRDITTYLIGKDFDALCHGVPGTCGHMRQS